MGLHTHIRHEIVVRTVEVYRIYVPLCIDGGVGHLGQKSAFACMTESSPQLASSYFRQESRPWHLTHTFSPQASTLGDRDCSVYHGHEHHLPPRY